MSEVKNVEHVTTLEDLFLSREFGKSVALVAPTKDDTLFGGSSPRVPLVPLAAAPTAGHLSTTHQRRRNHNQMFAAVSGVAAALLIAVGFVAGAGKTKSPGTTSATGTTTPTNPGHKGSGGPTGGTPVTPGTGGAGATLAGSGGSGRVTTATLVDIVTPNQQPIDGGGGTKSPPPVATTPTPTGTSGGVLSPVVALLGHVVTTAGTTVSTASVGLEGTLPGLAPVTGVVGSLGSTLTGLGNSLITTA